VILGRGVRQLKPWSRKPATLLAGLGLLLYPVGSLLSPYILYLLLSGKGRFVFSPAYREVISQTPELRYRTPPALWIALIVVLSVFAVLVTRAALGIDWSARPQTAQ
jgi:hypothetical protein